MNPGTFPVQVRTADNTTHTVRIRLDNDTDPANRSAAELVPETAFPAGEDVRSFTASLQYFSGTYYLYVVVSDGAEPPTAF